MFRVKNILEDKTTDYTEQEFLKFTEQVIKENGDDVGLNARTVGHCLQYITNFCDNLEAEDRRFNISEFIRMQKVIGEKVNDFAHILQDIYNIHLSYDDYSIEGNDIEIYYERYMCGSTDYDTKVIPVTDLDLTNEEFKETYTEIKRKADEEAKRKREEAERLEAEKRKRERDKQERATYERLRKKFEDN